MLHRITAVVRWLALPLSRIRVRLATAGETAGYTPAESARLVLGKGRRYAAPVWRKAVRGTVVAAGLAAYFGLQYWIALLISRLWWWLIAAVFIVSASVALALASPISAFVTWMVLSPFAKNFLYLDFGWRAIPALTFDFVVIYFLALVLFVRSLANRSRPKRLTTGEWLLLAYILYVSAGMLFSRDVSTFGEMLRVFSRRLVPDVLALPVLYFTCKGVIREKKHVAWMAVSLSVFGLLMALAAFYEHYTGNRWYSLLIGLGIPLPWRDVGKGRASGVFEHVAAPAALTATSIFITYYLAMWTRRRYLKPVYIVAAVIMVIGAYFTYTRNVYTCVALFALLIPFLASGKRKQFAALTVLGTVALMFAAPRLLMNPEFARRMLDPQNVEARLSYARTTMNVIREHPWFGVGYGKLNEVQVRYVTDPRLIYYGPGGKVWTNISHNTWLTIIGEAGVVGAVFYFGAVLSFLRAVLRIRKEMPQNDFLGRDFVSIMFVSSLVFLVSITAASIYLVPYVNFLFWIQLATVMRLGEIQKSSGPVFPSNVSGPASIRELAPV